MDRQSVRLRFARVTSLSVSGTPGRCILARRLLPPWRTTGWVSTSHSKLSWSVNRSPILISIGSMGAVSGSAACAARVLDDRGAEFTRFRFTAQKTPREVPGRSCCRCEGYAVALAFQEKDRAHSQESRGGSLDLDSAATGSRAAAARRRRRHRQAGPGETRPVTRRRASRGI